MTNQLESLFEAHSADAPPSESPAAASAGSAGSGAAVARPRNTGGFGGGPVLAGGLVVAGSLLLAGIGVARILMDGDDPALAAHGNHEVVAKAGNGADDSTVTVTLPDANGNGIADALEPSSEPREDGQVDVTLPDVNGNGIPDLFEPGNSPITGKGDEGQTHVEPQPGGPVPKPAVYIIEVGDTLSKISGETGVPLDTLVELNDVKNPNMIYAGAALLLSPPS